jgi:hypothetical protein
MLLRCVPSKPPSKEQNKNIQLAANRTWSPPRPRNFRDDSAPIQRGRRLVSDAAWDPQDHGVLRHLSGGGVVVLEQKKVSVGACVAKHHVRITHKEKLSSNSDFRLVFFNQNSIFHSQ